MDMTVEKATAELEETKANTTKLVAEALKLAGEAQKLAAEQTKLTAEASKLSRERKLYPIVILGAVVSGLAGIAGTLITFWLKFPPS